ncbi:MAG: hypothetical protein OXE50_06965, partial [Chloroflexi bacterium]|nr:hypothetical protein [Chloroflexota bacterium]
MTLSFQNIQGLSGYDFLFFIIHYPLNSPEAQQDRPDRITFKARVAVAWQREQRQTAETSACPRF